MASVNALERYFRETGDTPSALAGRLHKPVSTITRLLKGQRGASAKLAVEIERGTKGMLTAAQIMDLNVQRFLQAAE